VSWLEVLLDPGALLRRVQRESDLPAPVGLALLLEGEFVPYRSVAHRQGWPDLEGGSTPQTDPGKRLLSAVILHLSGSGDAEAAYRRLTRVRESEIVTLALLLLAYLYSDTGRPQKAIKLLRQALPKHPAPLEETLLRLQLGMRLAEESDAHAAVTEAKLASRVASQVKPASWRKALRTIALHNLFAYDWRSGVTRRSPFSLPPRGEASLLMRPSILYAEGLSKYLGSTFERSLADPYTRSIRFQAVDPVETPLRGALNRAELVGDWNDVRQARTLLGRYLVLSRLGTPNGVPAAAIELLRRAGDADGVRAAAATVGRMGPLGQLRLVTQALVERGDLGAGEAIASLRLLRIGADLLEPTTVATAAAQLMADPAFFQAQWAESPDALAMLLGLAPAATQTEAALFTRSLIEANPDGPLVQGLAAVVAAIRWSDVDESERTRWLQLVREVFGTATQTHFVALRALLALATTNAADVESLLRMRFDAHPDVETLALVFDAFPQPPTWARTSAWPLISARLREAREQASRGSYGFGMIDVANLALAALQGRSNSQGWNDLVDFLLDPAVSMSSKTTALENLARPDVRLPVDVRRRLQSGLPAIAAFDDQLGVSPEAFRGAVLKLSAKTRAGARDELLVALLRLAGEPSAVSRIVAAGCLAAVQPRVGASVATTLALTLAHDPNHDVRGAAGRALAQLAGDGDETLDRARRGRLLTLLTDPGTVVPYGVLAGLYETTRTTSKLDGELRAAVESLEKQHPSRRVREAARSVLQLVRL
jgi:hypothetical protein